MLDLPAGPRRGHDEAKPRVGGMAIVPAVLLPLLALTGTPSVAAILHEPGSHSFGSLLVGAVAMHLFGVWDDLRELSPRVKLCGQVVIATAVFAGGVRLESLPVPGLGAVELSFWPSLVLTLFWLTAITNAFNLVDGADGVAAGTALWATLAMLVGSLVLGDPLAALVLAITAGALLGFLRFNLPPASVFLGDGGSLFLGFLLAGVGVAGSGSPVPTLAAVAPLIAFGLPVLDTAVVVVRRTIQGVSILRADRRHIHHRLLELGHSPRQVVVILYAVGGLFGLASLVVLSENVVLIRAVFLTLGVALCVGVRKLRIPELREIGQAIGRDRERSGRGAEGARAPAEWPRPAVRVFSRVLLSIPVDPVSALPDGAARKRTSYHGARETGAVVSAGGEPTGEG